MKKSKNVLSAMVAAAIIAIAFTGLSLCTTSGVYAQGTLQFNNVKLIGTVETVPAGKVWKIQNVLPGANFITAMACGSSSNNTQLTVEISVNSTTVVVMASRSCSQNNLFGSILTNPIWLPSSTTLAASTNAYRVSVIEFNVLP